MKGDCFHLIKGQQGDLVLFFPFSFRDRAHSFRTTFCIERYSILTTNLLSKSFQHFIMQSQPFCKGCTVAAQYANKWPKPGGGKNPNSRPVQIKGVGGRERVKQKEKQGKEGSL
eukprot:1147635-Pelagomonas_calceolata.AAC.12